MDVHAPDTTPAALNDLIAAGLVSHEVIGDPGHLGAEAETLRVLCGLIGGPVWRIDSFHYAFRAQPGDLGGRLGDAPPAAWAAALETALQAELGPEAIWVSPSDLVSEPVSGAAADLDQPLLLLRAQAGAVAGALEAAPPGTQAVVQACYAAEVARLTAGAKAGGALDRRLQAIEARQERMLAMLAARAGDDPMPAALEAVLHRLEAQDSQLRSLAAQLEGLAAAPPPAAAFDGFEETLGLTLAEFLARLENQAARPEPARLSS